MKKIFLATVLVVSLAAFAAAQDNKKYEGFAGFSLATVDTGMSGLVVGGNDSELAPGFEFSGTGYVTKHLGFEGDVDGHFKHNTFTFASATSAEDVSYKSFNFMGGPHYRFASTGKVTFFTRALAGANHSRLSDGRFNSAGGSLVPGTGSSETDFAMKFGGGLDVDWRKRLALRFGADYNPIFQNNDGNLNPEFGNRRTRNDVVFSAGLVFK